MTLVQRQIAHATQKQDAMDDPLGQRFFGIQPSSAQGNLAARNCDDAHESFGSTEGRDIEVTTPNADPPDPRKFDELRVLAESFEDAQKARIAIENRLRSGMVPEEVSAMLLSSAKATEHAVGLEMRRAFRRAAPEVYAWVKETIGLGDQLMARLLGAIGHPVWAYPMTWVEGYRPDGHECGPTCKKEGEKHLIALEPFRRNVGKLWAYCGHGDPTKRRRKGMTQDEAFGLGNPRAKTLIHLLAESCMKQKGSPAGSVSTTKAIALEPEADDAVKQATPALSTRRRSPYRDTYDQAREKYADREDWSDGHRHNAALRFTAKAILKDLWLVAGGHGYIDPQVGIAVGHGQEAS